MQPRERLQMTLARTCAGLEGAVLDVVARHGGTRAAAHLNPEGGAEGVGKVEEGGLIADRGAKGSTSPVQPPHHCARRGQAYGVERVGACGDEERAAARDVCDGLSPPLEAVHAVVEHLGTSGEVGRGGALVSHIP